MDQELQRKMQVNTEGRVRSDKEVLGFFSCRMFHLQFSPAWLHCSCSMAHRPVQLLRKRMTKPYVRPSAALCSGHDFHLISDKLLLLLHGTAENSVSTVSGRVALIRQPRVLVGAAGGHARCGGV